MVMGCYGIGVSRVVAAVVEEHHDEHGIAWPAALAPYDVHLVVVPGRARGRRGAAPARSARRSSSATSRPAGARPRSRWARPKRSTPRTTIPIDAWQRVDGRRDAGGVRRDRCARLARARRLARADVVARRGGRLVHAAGHDSPGAPADEAADDRVLVRVRPVRVRRHPARDRGGRDRRDAR